MNSNGTFLAPAAGPTEREAADERGDEPIPAQADRDQVAGRGKRQHEQLPGYGRRPSATVGEAKQPSAGEPGCDADDQPDGGSAQRVQQPTRVTVRLRRRQGDREDHEWGGDAVIEAALDVEQTPDPRRDDRVRDHRLPQCRIRRGEGRADQHGDAQWDARVQHDRRQAPEGDRQQEPDDQQAGHRGQIAAQGVRPHRGGVGEEEERQGDLGEDPDRLRLRLDGDRPQDIVGHHDADREERERGSDRDPIQACRDERVPGDQQREDGEVELHGTERYVGKPAPMWWERPPQLHA